MDRACHLSGRLCPTPAPGPSSFEGGGRDPWACDRLRDVHGWDGGGQAASRRSTANGSAMTASRAHWSRTLRHVRRGESSWRPRVAPGRRGEKRLHCQITWQETDGKVHDMDIGRAPQLVKSCTAATCAGIVGQPTDPFGIAPDSDTSPKATFNASLTSTDSHSVNKLVEKWAAQRVDEQKHLSLHRLRRLPRPWRCRTPFILRPWRR